MKIIAAIALGWVIQGCSDKKTPATTTTTSAPNTQAGSVADVTTPIPPQEFTPNQIITSSADSGTPLQQDGVDDQDVDTQQAILDSLSDAGVTSGLVENNAASETVVPSVDPHNSDAQLDGLSDEAIAAHVSDNEGVIHPLVHDSDPSSDHLPIPTIIEPVIETVEIEPTIEDLLGGEEIDPFVNDTFMADPPTPVENADVIQY